MNRPDILLSLSWATGKLSHIDPYLPAQGRILDIGSGRGLITAELRTRGYEVTPLDVRDRSAQPAVRPRLYDGGTIPFPDNHFDCALLLTVLHHTPDPAAVIREASRVAQQIIIIEDVYTNRVQKYLTFFTDSLFNLEFRGHPHTNKRDAEWRAVFDELGLRVTGSQTRPVLLFYRQCAYNLLKG